MKYYKFFRLDGRTMHGRDPWPENEWLPDVEGEIVPCVNGYHVCRPQDVAIWIGPLCYEAELRSDIVEDEEKVVARSARIVGPPKILDAKTLCQFSIDCAEHVLPIYEKLLDPELKDFRLVLTKARKYINDPYKFDSDYLYDLYHLYNTYKFDRDTYPYPYTYKHPLFKNLRYVQHSVTNVINFASRFYYGAEALEDSFFCAREIATCARLARQKPSMPYDMNVLSSMTEELNWESNRLIEYIERKGEE